MRHRALNLCTNLQLFSCCKFRLWTKDFDKVTAGVANGTCFQILTALEAAHLVSARGADTVDLAIKTNYAGLSLGLV